MYPKTSGPDHETRQIQGDWSRGSNRARCEDGETGARIDGEEFGMELGARINLTGLTANELTTFVCSVGEPAYRARQIFAGVHDRRQRSFADMTDLPKELRAKLSDQATVATLKLESRYVSTDGTRRYLFKTHDHRPVETVFIPEERRDTICFSSQSGCPLQCTFCLTAQLGLLRNLTAGEIVEQVIFALNDAYGVA